MKKIVLTEEQMRRLMDKVIAEQVGPPPAPGTTAPMSGLNSQNAETPLAPGTPETATPGVPGETPEVGDEPPVDGEVPADGEPPLSAGGGASDGDAFSDGGAGADSNSKMHKWDSGASRGKANPLGTEGPWESGVSRGAANQIGVTKWEDTVGATTSRGRANELMESKRKRKKK
jgi:hypothetical protein